MVKIVNGNLLDAKEDIIAHQVNCRGVMGSGVALAIREKWPKVYEEYKKCVDKMTDMGTRGRLLGVVWWVIVGEAGNRKRIANVFGQDNLGRDGKQYTDYKALKKGLEEVAYNASVYGRTIAMPWGIGCGTGGGDWEGVVEPMINDIADRYGVEIVLYRL